MGGFAGAVACARPELPDPSDAVGPASTGDAEVPSDAKADPPRTDAGIVTDSNMRPGVPDASRPTADAGKPAPADAGKPATVDAGEPASADAGGPTLPDPPPDAGEAPTEGDLCRLDGRDVAILGDSFIRLTGDFTRLLQNKARAAGALRPAETYVDVSRPLASMVREPGIPAQYPEAVSESRRRGGTVPQLVIMTGGGQDVLVDNRPCLNPESVEELANTPECVDVVNEVLDASKALIDTAVEGGTKAAIYFFYPNLPRNSLAGGANGNSVINWAAPLAKAVCESQTRAPCYFIDLRPAFADPSNPGYPRPGLIGFDGVSPTEAGSQIVADEVWKVMQAHCLGTM